VTVKIIATILYKKHSYTIGANLYIQRKYMYIYTHTYTILRLYTNTYIDTIFLYTLSSPMCYNVPAKNRMCFFDYCLWHPYILINTLTALQRCGI
jgi:hypothetical protein